MQTIAQQLKITKFPFEIKDDKGNCIYLENSEGYWSKSKYDEKENLIYHENSGGYWYKHTYDKKGNSIYYESSTGFWSKREFDEKSNQIYHENSDGLIVDNRPKCENKVVEVDGIKFKR